MSVSTLSTAASTDATSSTDADLDDAAEREDEYDDAVCLDGSVTNLIMAKEVLI